MAKFTEMLYKLRYRVPAFINAAVQGISLSIFAVIAVFSGDIIK